MGIIKHLIRNLEIKMNKRKKNKKVVFLLTKSAFKLEIANNENV